MDNFEIIAKYLNNEANPAEKQELEIWLAKDENNAALFEELKLAWNKLDAVEIEEDFDTETALNSVHEKIRNQDNIIPITGKKPNSKWLLRVAAVLAIGFFTTWILLNNSGAQMIVAATSSDTRTITLPDGSTIWMNKNSKITYPERFDDNAREVKLEGEAFFDIKKDPSRPFSIEGKDFNVKVLGTSFNVCETNNNVTVTVETGTVSFTTKANNALTLIKGETGIYHRDNNSSEESVNTDLNFMAWKTHQLSFDNTTVAIVLADIERYFGTKIDIEEKTILNCKFTGSFPNAKLQDILKLMEGSLNIKVRTEQNRVTISGKGCNE